MTKRLKTIFMGTPELAVPALEILAQHSDVIRVVTQPDRPAGRGKKMRAPAVKVAAEALSIPVWQPETLRGKQDAPELQGADLFVVLAYGEILRQPVLDLPKIDCINLHASLLPRWRGASPLQACIRAGDLETGVSVMRMVRALDAGPVFHKQTIPLSDSVTLPEVHDQLAVCSATALAYYLAHYMELQAVEQDESLVTYCGKLQSEDGHLDFNQSVTELDRCLRAYTPVPGCWVNADDQRMRVQSAIISDCNISGEPGTVFMDGSRAFVNCTDGVLELLKIQAAGKRAMEVADYVNGHDLPARFN